MSALFDFNAFLTVVLLTICTCTYVKMSAPSVLNQRKGFRGLFWKAARVGSARKKLCTVVRIVVSPLLVLLVVVGDTIHTMGERLSPWVGLGCIAMGLTVVFH